MITEQESKTNKEREFPGLRKLEAIRSVVGNFLHPNWEQVERIKKLSGLTDVEIDSLPTNDLVTRFLTSLMRAWQKDIRTSSDPGSDQRNVASEELLKSGESTYSFIYTPDNLQQPVPMLRYLNDYVNPFSINGERIYGTEYAQLVNIAARKASQEGVLTQRDVLKLTFLAVMQDPPGKMTKNQLSSGVLRQEFIEQFILGKRVSGEDKLMREDKDILSHIPLTLERIQDKEFVRAISTWKVLVSFRILLAAMVVMFGFMFHD